MDIKKILNPAITGYDDQYGVFTCSDRSVFNLFKIRTHDLITSSKDDVQLEMGRWAKFYRLYGGDCNIIALNTPCNYSAQIAYWERRRDSSPLKDWCSQKISELEQVERNTTREFFLMAFVNSLEAYPQAEMQILTSFSTGAAGQLATVGYDEKIYVLKKLFNKNMDM